MGKKASETLQCSENLSSYIKNDFFLEWSKTSSCMPLIKTIRDKIGTVKQYYMRRRFRVIRRDKLSIEEIWRRMRVICSITERLQNKAL